MQLMGLRYLKRVKSLRFDDVLVTWEVMKSYIYLVMFFINAITLVATIVGISIDYVVMSSTLFSLIAVPMYTLQIIWMLQREFAKNLIKHRRRIRTAVVCGGTRF